MNRLNYRFGSDQLFYLIQTKLPTTLFLILKETFYFQSYGHMMNQCSLLRDKKKHQNPKINVSTASKFEVHFGHNSFFFPRNPNFNNLKTSKLKQITSRSYKKINKIFFKKRPLLASLFKPNQSIGDLQARRGPLSLQIFWFR